GCHFHCECDDDDFQNSLWRGMDKPVAAQRGLQSLTHAWPAAMASAPTSPHGRHHAARGNADGSGAGRTRTLDHRDDASVREEAVCTCAASGVEVRLTLTQHLSPSAPRVAYAARGVFDNPQHNAQAQGGAK